MTTYYSDDTVTLHHGGSLDVLRGLPDGSVNCCVTSPPYYGLRSYLPAGHPDKVHEIGTEATPAEFVEKLRALFTEVRRVLADDGTFWLNLGDSYSTRKVVRDSSHQPGMHANRTDHDTIGKTWVQNRESGKVRMPSDTGVPEKNLLGIPWRVALALQDDGWILRNEIIWHKPTGMPEAVTDRLSSKHEHLFLFSKSRRYWFDLDPIRETPIGEMRPQRKRAEELFKQHGLTSEHLAAIRSVGVTDVGKATVTHSGAGKNRAEVQALADEAKAALGGYYREFLSGSTTKYADGDSKGVGATGERHLFGHPLGKNPGDVWTIQSQPFPGAHFATFPPELPERCIRTGCKPGGTVLDPFSGSGTTGMVAQRNGRKYVGIDLNSDYLDLSLRTRLADQAMEFPA